VELDPKYCDVIAQRWQAWAGGIATLEGDGRSYEEIAAREGAQPEGILATAGES
jgi:hypothetical protein